MVVLLKTPLLKRIGNNQCPPIAQLPFKQFPNHFPAAHLSVLIAKILGGYPSS